MFITRVYAVAAFFEKQSFLKKNPEGILRVHLFTTTPMLLVDRVQGNWI